MIDEATRARYAEAMRKLSEFFPDRCDERVKLRYFERLIECRPPPDAMDEAVERLIDTHKTRSLPPWSAIADRLRDIAQRNWVAPGAESEPEPCRLTPEEIEAQLAEVRKFRLKVMPPRKPNIRADLEARRKKLGYKPLTRAEIDMLNRKKRERECARIAKDGTTPA